MKSYQNIDFKVFTKRVIESGKYLAKFSLTLSKGDLTELHIFAYITNPGTDRHREFETEDNARTAASVLARLTIEENFQ